MKDKARLVLVKAHNIHVTNFENKLETFKGVAFARNHDPASGRFTITIAETDKSIDHLQSTRDTLRGPTRNLRLCTDRAEDVTIGK